MGLGQLLHHKAYRVRDGRERSAMNVPGDPKRVRRLVKVYPEPFLPRPSHRHHPLLGLMTSPTRKVSYCDTKGGEAPRCTLPISGFRRIRRPVFTLLAASILSYGCPATSSRHGLEARDAIARKPPLAVSFPKISQPRFVAGLFVKYDRASPHATQLATRDELFRFVCLVEGRYARTLCL
jgi:hypothetical protein